MASSTQSTDSTMPRISQASATANHDEHKTSILDLPPELRLIIYDFYLASLPYQLIERPSPPGQQHAGQSITSTNFRPSLLHINRQFRQESLKPYLARLQNAQDEAEANSDALELRRQVDDYDDGTVDGARAFLYDLRALKEALQLLELLQREIEQVGTMLENGCFEGGESPSLHTKHAEELHERFGAVVGEDTEAIVAFTEEHGLTKAEFLTLFLAAFEREFVEVWGCRLDS